MTKHEYEQAAQAIRIKAAEEQKALDLQYALSRAQFKVGDIIRDHTKAIVIESIAPTWNFMSRMPECEFVGREVYMSTFKLKPSEETVCIKQSYITKYAAPDYTWQTV